MRLTPLPLQLGEIDLAVQDFEMAQSLRAYDPYSVACLGISLVHQGLVLLSQSTDEDAGRERTQQGLAELTSAVVGVSRSNSTGEELAMPAANGEVDIELQELILPSHAYDPFFLRGQCGPISVFFLPVDISLINNLAIDMDYHFYYA